METKYNFFSSILKCLWGIKAYIYIYKLSPPSETKAPLRPNRCKNQKCRYCPKIMTDGTMTSPFDNKAWTTKTNVNCCSHNLVYAIQCKLCHLIYVGQTGQNIKTRFNNHFYDINKNPNTFVSAHFTSPNHNRLEDVKIFVLAFIKTPCTSAISKTQRLHEEALWQHRLHSLAPHGLNTLDENRAH